MASVVGIYPALKRDARSLAPEPRRTERHIARSPRIEERASLAAVLEGEIIPRLMVAHGVSPIRQLRPAGPAAISQADIEGFAATAIAGASDDLLALIEEMLARPVSADALLVDLMAPTARQLGTWWEDDRCDFVEVTMGLWRLQEVVRELSMRSTRNVPGGRRALFAAMPGEQHQFGTSVVDEMFRRNGWDSEMAIGAGTAELLDQVSREWFDLVGLTVSCDSHIATLPSILVALRSVSHNPRVVLMVGGRVFAEDPSLAVRVGADSTAADARLALIAAEALVESIARAA